MNTKQDTSNVFCGNKKEVIQIAKKAYHIRNWKDYNKSLKERGSLTFWFSQEALTN